MNQKIALSILALWAAGSTAAAEPKSRAGPVAQALKANPQVRRAQEDEIRLRGLITEARADALPDLTVTGSALRYRDPMLLNSSSFDSFPPDLRDSLKPSPANLYDGTASLRQTLFSFKLSKAIPAAKLGASYGRAEGERVRQAMALE